MPVARPPLPRLTLGPILRELSGEALCTESVDLLHLHGAYVNDRHRLHLPWEAMAAVVRDLTGATAGALVNAQVGPFEAALRPYSAIIQAGARALGGLREPLPIPREGTAPTAHWLTDEADQIPASTPGLGLVNLTPRHVGSFVQFSRLLRVAAPAVESYLSRSLVGAVAEAIDAAALGGSGTAGEPLGIVNTPSVNTLPGAAFDWAGVQAALELVRDAGARGPRWILSPDVAEILAGRARVADTERPILDGADMGAPAIVSRTCPDQTAVLADWGAAVVAAAFDGLRIELDPFSRFQSGLVGARVLTSADVGVLQPGAVSRQFRPRAIRAVVTEPRGPARIRLGLFVFARAPGWREARPSCACKPMIEAIREALGADARHVAALVATPGGFAVRLKATAGDADRERLYLALARFARPRPRPPRRGRAKTGKRRG